MCYGVREEERVGLVGTSKAKQANDTKLRIENIAQHFRGNVRQGHSLIIWESKWR